MNYIHTYTPEDKYIPYVYAILPAHQSNQDRPLVGLGTNLPAPSFSEFVLKSGAFLQAALACATLSKTMMKVLTATYI